MAGRGPAPKPDGQRARRNAPAQVTLMEVKPAEQPELNPEIEWPEETKAWWKAWKDSPLSAGFIEIDWVYLQDTALLHAQLWGNGDLSALAELRIRVAKYGATPEDRARLRIQFATADDLEVRAHKSTVAAKKNYGKLRSVK